ncbi:RNA polymerase sigma factor RpoH [Legionella sp. W05-934-2]|jgi:RNA polymerase sigma-32 factor|uniref:RNA polymerase sigma factor RpoH n=1 Tax=Legionella sp. W05-934-2 TaxID=1198649 RepID=UPI0034626957
MSKQLQLASINLPIGSLDAYIHHVNQFPMLSAEEEYGYAQRFQSEGCIESARQLVLAHLRYVVRVARGYLGYGLPLNDLIQEGNIGLMKAVKRFDPTMGVRLVSFAVHWIKAEIHEYVIRNWRIVKIATTKAQRKLFFKLRQMKTRLGWSTPEEIKAIAHDLGVSPKEVTRMERRLNARDAAFDEPVDDDTNAPLLSPVQYLQDPNSDPALLIEKETIEERNHENLVYAMESLDDRAQDILKQRWLTEKKLTLHDLAAKYGVSAERVRQLEKNAMIKLRKKLEEMA